VNLGCGLPLTPEKCETRGHGVYRNNFKSRHLATRLGVFDSVVDRLVSPVGRNLAGAAVCACGVCGFARCRKSAWAGCRPRLGQSSIDEVRGRCVDAGAPLVVRARRAAVARARLADRLYNLAQLDQLSVETALAPVAAGLGEDGEGALMAVEHMSSRALCPGPKAQRIRTGVAWRAITAHIVIAARWVPAINAGMTAVGRQIFPT
jgi:hypothetical protein